MQEGDYVALPYEDGLISVIKVLRVDEYPPGEFIFHCMTFDLLKKPIESITKDDLQKVIIKHSPIEGRSIRQDGTVIFNSPVTEEELDGFYVYLEYIDPQRLAFEKELNNQNPAHKDREKNKPWWKFW